MDINDETIRNAVAQTEILRAPKQSLYTFGTTNINYYLLTRPVYSEAGAPAETVVRDGKVIAERPRIVTPYYLSRLEGFSSEARRYFEALMQEFGPQSPGVLYSYRNEPGGLTIISEDMRLVIEKINAEIDERGDALAAIIRGEDALWDVSLLKFIFEVTRNSVGENVQQMGRRGLLGMDSRGIPNEARMRIEGLFGKVAGGEIEPRQLKDELDRWDVYDEYEDRFMALFRKGAR